MAEYRMPARLYLGNRDIYFLRYVRTYGRRLAPKMDPWQKVTKKRLTEPTILGCLDAVANDRFVNHLGRGHSRTHPYASSHFD